MVVLPEGIHISLKLPESLLRFVGVCLSLAGITVCLRHAVHVLTHLHHLSAVIRCFMVASDPRGEFFCYSGVATRKECMMSPEPACDASTPPHVVPASA